MNKMPYNVTCPPIVKRKEWGAVPRVKGLLPLVHPVQHVVITYWTSTKNCFQPTTCRAHLRKLQKQAIDDQSLADIPYNFMIGSCLEIYEGRGWDIASDKSLPKKEFYGNRIDIAFLGNFLKRKPQADMLYLAIRLIRYGVFREFLEVRHIVHQLRDVPIE